MYPFDKKAIHVIQTSLWPGKYLVMILTLNFYSFLIILMDFHLHISFYPQKHTWANLIEIKLMTFIISGSILTVF